MIVGVVVIDLHVFKERLHVLIEEALHHTVVEVCIDENRPDVSFDDIW
jgi:hypothetical protein